MILNKLWKIVLVSALLSASCGTETLSLGNLPIPPNAKRDLGEAEAFRTPFDLSVVDVIRKTREHYGKAKCESYLFANETNWQEVAGFYDEALKEKGFVRVSSQPQKLLDAEILFYEQSHFLERQAVAVALIEARKYTEKREEEWLYDKRHFLFICLNQ